MKIQMAITGTTKRSSETNFDLVPSNAGFMIFPDHTTGLLGKLDQVELYIRIIF